MATHKQTASATAAAKVAGRRSAEQHVEVDENNLEHAMRLLSANKRRIIALVGNVLTIGAGLYVGMTVTVIMTNAAFVLTGSAFIAWMVYFIGYLLTWAGSVLGGFLVQNMLLEGGAAERVAAKTSEVCGNAMNSVRGLFSRKAEAA
jgi:hypothetical protein